MFISIFKQIVLQKFRYVARLLRDEKLPPLIILPVILFLLGCISYFVVVQKKAAIVYVFWILLLIFNSISNEKKQFYQQQFKPSVVYWIQIIEISTVAFPFILFLLIYKYILYSALIISVLIVYPVLNVQKYNFRSVKTVPTPYLKESYEMNYGFRAALIPNIILSIFFIMSIYVGNANLFLGVLIIYFYIQILISYSVFEDPMMLRQYFLSPSQILFAKFKQVAINHFAFLIVAVVCSLFFKELKISLLVLLIALFSAAYNCFAMLLKYSFFQHKITNTLVQEILLFFFLIMPAAALLFPFLCYVFYQKATNKLKQILS